MNVEIDATSAEPDLRHKTFYVREMLNSTSHEVGSELVDQSEKGDIIGMAVACIGRGSIPDVTNAATAITWVKDARQR